MTRWTSLSSILRLDDRVGMAAPADAVELVEIERDGDRVEPMPEYDRWDTAGLAQMRYRLADLGSARSG